jgi:hypothetical protein
MPAQFPRRPACSNASSKASAAEACRKQWAPSQRSFRSPWRFFLYIGPFISQWMTSQLAETCLISFRELFHIAGLAAGACNEHETCCRLSLASRHSQVDLFHLLDLKHASLHPHVTHSFEAV